MSLCDAMKKCGWSEPKLWHEITENDFVKMGFKKGHIKAFNHKYTEWKKMYDWIDDKLTFKSLFEKWKLPNYLYDNMKLHVGIIYYFGAKSMIKILSRWNSNEVMYLNLSIL